MEFAAVILWYNRYNRNELVWEGASKPASKILNRAGVLLAEWRSVNDVQTADQRPAQQQQKRWAKPPAGKVKCNIDAALFQDPVGMGFGGVLRDNNGQFVAAVQGHLAGCFSPCLAEAVGLKEVLSWVKNRSDQSILIEMDSKLIVDAINSVVDDASSLGIVIDDCKALVRAISDCSVVFAYRSANAVAHGLARAAASVTGLTVWEDMFPPFISDVLAADLN